MIFRQFLHFEPVAASYLFGCAGHATCAVVDPLGDVEPYVRAAEETGMKIRYVIDTHVHADHLSAGRALAERAGAEYVLHRSVAPNGVADGQQLGLGNVIVDVLHTPGHTPEHISLLVTDRTRGAAPWLVFTGHTLMVGDMGRTELAGEPEEGARMLYESARRLRALPDEVEVWPGAFSGSACGKALSGKPSSTIGFERRFNRTFRIDDAEEFIDAALRDLPAPPSNAAEIRAINLGARPDPITHRMKVWSILTKWPATYDVFRRHGCPDMRRGFFSISARIMPLTWAARFHRVPLEHLLRELNACANGEQKRLAS